MSPLPRRGRRRTGKEPGDDAEPETPVAPTTGVPRRLGRRGGHARGRRFHRSAGEAGERCGPREDVPAAVQRPLRGRDPEPGRVPPRRNGRRDALPRGDRRPLPRLAAPPARPLQRALRVRGGVRQGRPEPGARPRGTGAELEAVRPQGLRQRRRGGDLGPAPVRPRPLRGPLPVWQGGAHRRRASPEGGDHGLEPVRGRGSRQREPALRGPRVPAHEPHHTSPDRRSSR